MTFVARRMAAGSESRRAAGRVGVRLRRNRAKLLVLLVTAGLLVSGPMRADTIYLKSGEVVTGAVTGQTRTAITVRTADGRLREIPKSQIDRTIFKPSASEETRADEEGRKREKNRADEAARQREDARRREEARRRAKIRERETTPRTRDNRAPSDTSGTRVTVRAGLAFGEHEAWLAERLAEDQLGAGLLIGGMALNTPWENKQARALPIGLEIAWDRFRFAFDFYRMNSAPYYQNLTYIPRLQISNGALVNIVSLGETGVRQSRENETALLGYRVFGGGYGGHFAGTSISAHAGIRRRGDFVRMSQSSVNNIEIVGLASGFQLQNSLLREARVESLGPLIGLSVRQAITNAWELRAALSFYRLRGRTNYNSSDITIDTSGNINTSAVQERGAARLRGLEYVIGLAWNVADRHTIFLETFADRATYQEYDVTHLMISTDDFERSLAPAAYWAARGGGARTDRWAGLRFGWELAL